jgi:hypothetical protein
MQAKPDVLYVAIAHYTCRITKKVCQIRTPPFTSDSADSIGVKYTELEDVAHYRARLKNGMDPIDGLSHIDVYELPRNPVLSFTPKARER